MPEPLDEQYFMWLYQKVASVRLKNPALTYWSLLRQLHKKEFVWLIANDDNRVEDGKDLRIAFLDEVRESATSEWLSMGCSMLEMLIALSARLAYESEDDKETDDWFWELMRNIGLHEYADLYFKNVFTLELVNEALDRVIKRQYDETGYGGLFPLTFPRSDQRKVELWYQMSSYLLERQ